ncbi:putative ubiquitinyl hydrolase 1 [Helianthus anomalus]
MMTKPPPTMRTYTWTINQFSTVTKEHLRSDVLQKTKHWLCNAIVDWGFSCFALLSQLNDSKNRFILNDNITVEVEISVIRRLGYFI